MQLLLLSISSCNISISKNFFSDSVNIYVLWINNILNKNIKEPC